MGIAPLQDFDQVGVGIYPLHAAGREHPPPHPDGLRIRITRMLASLPDDLILGHGESNDTVAGATPALPGASKAHDAQIV